MSGNGIIWSWLWYIARVYLTMGNLDKAYEYLNKEFEILKKTGDKFREPQYYNPLGEIYYYKGEFDKSLEAWQKCLEIYRSISLRFMMRPIMRIIPNPDNNVSIL